MAPPSPSKPGPLTSHPVTSTLSPTSTALNMSPSKQRSRFQEGSMNDRTSAVPPLSFIGAEQEAFERRMELHYPGSEPAAVRPPHDRAAVSIDSYPVQNSVAMGGANRPISAASSYTGKRGFWGGLKEKFSFSRDKADGPKRPVSLDTKFDRHAGMGALDPSAASAGATDRDAKQLPSREEIMANYQELMRNGFFDSHAIQSTRQPPPGGYSKPSTPSQPMSAPPGASFASRMGERPHRGQQQQNWPLPTIASPGADSQTSRGTKRMHSQDTDSVHSSTDPAATSSFKRLRKSASRISADISIPRLRNKRSHLTQEQQHAVDIASMPPPPAPAGITTRRSFSSSSKRDTNRLAKRIRPVNKAAISAPIPLPPPSADGTGSIADSFGLARMSIDSGAPSFASSVDSRPGSSATTSKAPTNWSVAPNAEADVPEPAAPPPALRVRPDANRGIPMVPRIPEQFKTRSGHRGVGAENFAPAPFRQSAGPWAR